MPYIEMVLDITRKFAALH